MFKKILFIIPFVICTIWMILAIAKFVHNFNEYHWSDDVAHWGQVGDYFGGMLNPALSLMSLLLTFYIAKEVHSLNENQAKQQVQVQREILSKQLQASIVEDFNERQLRCMIDVFIVLKTDNSTKGQLTKHLIELSATILAFTALAVPTFQAMSKGSAAYGLCQKAMKRIVEWTESENWKSIEVGHEVNQIINQMLTTLYVEINS